jgi:hypothetical protein
MIGYPTSPVLRLCFCRDAVVSFKSWMSDGKKYLFTVLSSGSRFVRTGIVPSLSSSSDHSKVKTQDGLRPAFLNSTDTWAPLRMLFAKVGRRHTMQVRALCRTLG